LATLGENGAEEISESSRNNLTPISVDLKSDAADDRIPGVTNAITELFRIS
jgi:hypothetical protein